MNIEFKQEAFKRSFVYFALFDNGRKIKVTAKRTILPFISREVAIKDDQDNLLMRMKEKRIFKKVISKVPVINLITPLFIRNRDKYDLYQHEHWVGSIEWFVTFKKRVMLISYKGKAYEVYNRGKGKLERYYIFEDKQQIGIIDKHFVTKNYADQYTGRFNNNTDRILNIIIFTFIDLSMYTQDIRTRRYSNTVEVKFTIAQPSNTKLGVELADDWKPR